MRFFFIILRSLESAFLNFSKYTNDIVAEHQKKIRLKNNIDVNLNKPGSKNKISINLLIFIIIKIIFIYI